MTGVALLDDLDEPSGWTALHFAADFGAQTLDVMGKVRRSTFK